MRKTYSDLTAEDMRKWSVRHKFMTPDGSVGGAVRAGAPRALAISDRQYYDYMSGKALIPAQIALIMDMYDRAPKWAKAVKQQVLAEAEAAA